MANAYGMAMKYLPWRVRKKLSIKSFVRQIIHDRLFQKQNTTAHMIPTTNSKTRVSGRSVASSVSSIKLPSFFSIALSINRTTQLPNLATDVVVTLHSIEQVSSPVGGQEQLTLVSSPQQLISSQAIDPYVHTILRHADTLAYEINNKDV